MLGIDIKFSEHTITVNEGIYEGWLAPMFEINYYDFKLLTDKIIKLEELFINSYVDKYVDSITIGPTQQMRRILDAKYKK